MSYGGGLTMKITLDSLAKSAYMTVIKLLSMQFNKKSNVENIGYLMSFPHNEAGVIDLLSANFDKKKIILFYTANCDAEARIYQEQGYQIIALDSVKMLKKVVQELVNCRWLLCDNYFPILGAVELNEACRVIQLWHANGAIKKFGWEDSKTNARTKQDKARFKKVYDRFDFYLVGSDAMANVFQKSYGADLDKMLKFGFHRADMLFDKKEHITSDNQQVCLYMPTYRSDNSVILETLKALEKAAGEKQITILYKLHPVTIKALQDELTFVNLKGIELTDESYDALYPRVGYLITDYSSVPFDYALANPTGRIQFYWPDFETYNQVTGIQDEIKDKYADEALKTTEQLLASLSNETSIDLNELNEHWNKYNNGEACNRLIDFMKS